MSKTATPFDMALAAHRLWWLAAEVNTVLALRMMGMAGGGNVTEEGKPKGLVEPAEAASVPCLHHQPAAKQRQRNRFHSSSLQES